MRIDNLTFPPIRLGLRRLTKDAFEISRDGTVLGRVKRERDVWRALETRHSHWHDSHRATSFRTAALKLARQWTYVSSDGPQNFGQVHMIRVDARGCWYTVIFSPFGRNIYEDHTMGKALSPAKQAELKLVIREADKFAKENL